MTAHLLVPADPHAEPSVLYPDGTRASVAAMSCDPRALTIALAALGFARPHGVRPRARLPLAPLPPLPCPPWCTGPAAMHHDDADDLGRAYRSHVRATYATERASVTLSRTDAVHPFAQGRSRVSVLADDLEPVAARTLADALRAAADLLEDGAAR